MPGRGKTKHKSPSFPLLLLLAALAAVVSLGTVFRAYAMPVEARTTAPWYAYQSTVGFDFTAIVKQGRFYSDSRMRPDALVKTRLPVEPPMYRRILLSKFTDAIEIKIPYSYKADRDANVKATLRVDGTIIVPNVWQKPYPIMDSKSLKVEAGQVTGTETITIPVPKLLGDLEAAKNEANIQLEPAEIHIHPVLEIEVTGLQHPINLVNDPEFLIVLHQGTVEVDDPREGKVDRNFSETKVVPITVRLLGRDVKVAVLRQISMYSLMAFLILAIVLVVLRRKKPDNRSMLQKLGPNLVIVRSFEVPGDAAVAEVRSAKELIQLQIQTDRPVIKVGNTYYLLDGTTCYRLTLQDGIVGDD